MPPVVATDGIGMKHVENGQEPIKAGRFSHDDLMTMGSKQVENEQVPIKAR